MAGCLSEISWPILACFLFVAATGAYASEMPPSLEAWLNGASTQQRPSQGEFPVDPLETRRLDVTRQVRATIPTIASVPQMDSGANAFSGRAPQQSALIDNRSPNAQQTARLASIGVHSPTKSAEPLPTANPGLVDSGGRPLAPGMQPPPRQAESLVANRERTPQQSSTLAATRRLAVDAGLPSAALGLVDAGGRPRPPGLPPQPVAQQEPMLNELEQAEVASPPHEKSHAPLQKTPSIPIAMPGLVDSGGRPLPPGYVEPQHFEPPILKEAHHILPAALDDSQLKQNVVASSDRERASLTAIPGLVDAGGRPLPPSSFVASDSTEQAGIMPAYTPTTRLQGRLASEVEEDSVRRESSSLGTLMRSESAEATAGMTQDQDSNQPLYAQPRPYGAAPPVGAPNAYGRPSAPMGYATSPAISQAVGMRMAGGCLVPMWKANDYVCEEATGSSKKSSKIKDSEGRVRVMMEHKATCTVACPDGQSWLDPDVSSMVCKQGKWESDVGDEIAGVNCRTGLKMYLFIVVMALLVTGVTYYIMAQRRKKREALLLAQLESNNHALDVAAKQLADHVAAAAEEPSGDPGANSSDSI